MAQNSGYLGEDKFKAFSEGVRAGAVYAFTDSLKGAFGASAVRTSSKSSGTVIEAKNKQWNYALNFALQKEFVVPMSSQVSITPQSIPV